MTDRLDTVVVFTARSPERIVREGGSQAWKLNPARVKSCQWLVCTQNRHHPDHNFSDATQPHGSAFMVAKISGVTDRTDHGPGGRWKIEISEYALVDIPNAWGHDRNPVRYTSLKKMGIDPDDLDFQPMPSNNYEKPTGTVLPDAKRENLTIDEAKRLLAITFGVRSEAIEITIRG